MKKLLKWIGILFLGFVVLVVIVALAGGGGGAPTTTAEARPTKTPRPSATPRNTATAKPTASPRPTATPLPELTDDFATIREKAKSMTDAQWDAYAKTLTNKRAHWTGWVEEAKSNGDLWIDMDDPSDVFSVQDCYVSVPAADAPKYNKDQQVEWWGTVKSVTRVLGSLGVKFTDTEVQRLP